jgi:hypothetical protein
VASQQANSPAKPNCSSISVIALCQLPVLKLHRNAPRLHHRPIGCRRLVAPPRNWATIVIPRVSPNSDGVVEELPCFLAGTLRAVMLILAWRSLAHLDRRKQSENTPA